MTLAQIAAIISLLMAFNVPQPTVNTVQNILNAKIATTTLPTSTPFITQATTTVTFTPVDTTPTAPTFGATIQSMPQDLSAISVTVLQPTERSKAEKTYGEYGFLVSVLDSNGKAVEGADISFARPSDDENIKFNQPTTKKAKGQTTRELADWHTTYSYIPTTKGEKTLIFTSGSLTKSITIDVQ